MIEIVTSTVISIPVSHVYKDGKLLGNYQRINKAWLAVKVAKRGRDRARLFPSLNTAINYLTKE